MRKIKKNSKLFIIIFFVFTLLTILYLFNTYSGFSVGAPPRKGKGGKGGKGRKVHPVSANQSPVDREQLRRPESANGTGQQTTRQPRDAWASQPQTAQVSNTQSSGMEQSRNNVGFTVPTGDTSTQVISTQGGVFSPLKAFTQCFRRGGCGVEQIETQPSLAETGQNQQDYIQARANGASAASDLLAPLGRKETIKRNSIINQQKKRRKVWDELHEIRQLGDEGLAEMFKKKRGKQELVKLIKKAEKTEKDHQWSLEKS